MSVGLWFFLLIWGAQPPGVGRAHVMTLQLHPLMPRTVCLPFSQSDAFEPAGRSRFRSAGAYVDHAKPGAAGAAHVSIETDRGLFHAPLPWAPPGRLPGHPIVELSTSFRAPTLAIGFKLRQVGSGGFLCRVDKSGAPICTTPVLTAAAAGSTEAEGPPVLSSAPDGSFLVQGRPLTWSQAGARRLPGPRSDHDRDVWGHVSDVQMSFFAGIDEVGLAIYDETGETSLQLQTPKGCLVYHRRKLQTHPGWSLQFATQTIGPLLLLKWTEGDGAMDPPEWDYQPFVHRFMACLVDSEGVPLCSDPVTDAKAHLDGDGNSDLANESFEAVDRNGGTFELSGLHFRVQVRVVDPRRDAARR